MSKEWRLWLAGLLALVAAILFQGYGFEKSDQIEILPILDVWNQSSSFFTNDFYVQSFLEKGLTERSIYLHVLNFTTGGQALPVLIVHLLVSLFLATGIVKIVTKLSGSVMIGCITAILVMCLGKYTSVGGNELYYNYLIPSLPAKALAVWALWHWLDHKGLTAMVLLALSTYFQPLVGLQLALVILLADLIMHKGKNALIQLGIYLILAGPWIFALLTMQAEGTLPAHEYFDIIEFRVAHHFFPSYFDLKDYLIFGVLLILVLVQMRRINKRLWTFSLVIFAGMVTYTFFTEMVPLSLALNTQWFKTSIWIELLGIMSIIVILRNVLNQDFDRFDLWPGLLIVILIGVAVLSKNVNPEWDPPIGKIATSESEISQWANQHTPTASTFVLPPAFNRFKILSRRSSYVDFKTMIHHHDYMEEYYARIKEVYNIDVNDRRSLGLARMLEKAQQTLNQKQVFPEEVNYVITGISNSTLGTPVYRTARLPQYFVYRLDN